MHTNSHIQRLGHVCLEYRITAPINSTFYRSSNVHVFLTAHNNVQTQKELSKYSKR